MEALTSISKAQIVSDVDGLAAQVTDITARIKAAEEAVLSAQANLDQLRIEKYRLEGEHRAIARMKASMEPVTEKTGL